MSAFRSIVFSAAKRADASAVKNVSVEIRFTTKEWEALKLLARDEDRPGSVVIRRAGRELLRKKGLLDE
jgi:hypothetical protein